MALSTNPDARYIQNDANATGTVGTLTVTTLSVTTVGTGATTITSASANSLAVGPNGTTNPVLKIDSSTSSQAAGLSITGATAAGNVAVAVISSGNDANLLINAKGTGTIGIGSVSTGAVTITPATNISAALTVTSTSASSFAVGRQGATTPSFSVDSSTGSQAAGLKVTGATTTGTVTVDCVGGAAVNLTINAKGTGTIGIGDVSTGAVTITPATTVTGAITPTGGVAAAGGFTVRPSNWHTGGIPAQVNTDGTDTTPSVTEMYYAAVFVPANATITGVSVFLGSATEGNMKVGLFNSAGANVATSASTDVSGMTVDTYNRIAFTGTYAAKGPATYYIGIMNDNTGNRFNSHTFGDFPTGKTTGETYATGFTTISSPSTTFTTALGPIASLY